MVRIHLQNVAATWGYRGQRSEILHGTLYGQYTVTVKYTIQYMPYKNTGSIQEKKLIFGHPTIHILFLFLMWFVITTSWKTTKLENEKMKDGGEGVE